MGNNTYHHQPQQASINCPHIWKSKQASKCLIYQAMKKKYQFTEQNLDHLNEYNHFQNEYEEKPKCKYG